MSRLSAIRLSEYDSDADVVLEAMIDRNSLALVLERIAMICDLKSEHLRSHWQAESAANDWRNAGTTLYCTSQKLLV